MCISIVIIYVINNGNRTADKEKWKAGIKIANMHDIILIDFFTQIKPFFSPEP